MPKIEIAKEMPSLKTKTPEPKISFTETGLVELSIKVPGLLPENVKTLIREVRHGLENCGRLDLLDEFIETRTVEYREGAN